LLGFAQYLAKQEHTVILATGDGPWLAEQAQAASVPYHRFRFLGRAIRPIRDLHALIELTRWLRQEKPDAVHLNSAKAGIIGSIAAKLAGVPHVVYRIGGWTFLEPLPRWQRLAYELAERLTAPLKDVIICVHEGDVEVARAKKIKPRKHLIAVANGIDLEVFNKELLSRDQARTALGIPHDVCVFGTIANFYPAKNLPNYLLACRDVCRQFPNTRIAIIGDGPERPQVELAIKSVGLENHVILVGARDQARSYLRAFDVFVLPSNKEGMSWSLLEALATGLPCIATDVGAAKNMLKDHGWLVPANQPEALTNAMLDALKHPEKQKPSAPTANGSLPTLLQTFSGNEEALLKR
jgi:glycosyltransferase involved in cell wall biosynthesis